MNITVEENERIKITLSKDEMLRCGISFAELDYDTEKSRSFLQNLYYCSGKITNFTERGERLEIEIFPLPNNGCTVYFTPIKSIKQEKKHKLHIPKISTLSGNFSADGLLDFAYELKKRGIIVKNSTLYETADGFFLVFTPFSCDLEETEKLLSRFSQNKTLSFINERDNIICKENALAEMMRFL